MKAMMIGAAALLTTMAAASPATAQANVMKECAAKYQAAKAGKTLPAGQTWIQYLAQCRGTMKAAAPAVAAAPVAAKTVAARTVATTTTTRTNVPVAARPPGQRTPGQIAEVSRQKQCGTQWKADKAAGKTGSLTWPQYWSACSKRLKG
ncbi:hypothetical protein [Sphingomonas bacterium]|uniref:hypothetical protein n=1 Tax=Sphingomonas bacterium TaxID=1895847 RepID=UPI0015769AF3|nr:hypothetical protein [Sphingomonas bacterium]